MNSQGVLTDVSCAVEVFIATALLHQEQPTRSDFTIQEIVNRAGRENITGEMRSGVNVHASQHCVANKAPNPARHRMLFSTGKHTRRLVLPGDEVNEGRTGRMFPQADEVPERYLSVLEWAKSRYEAHRGGNELWETGSAGNGSKQVKKPETAERWLESLFELEGLGKEHWEGVDPDDFVKGLREGWE